jgi:DNA-nicking Smr family endonuclease
LATKPPSKTSITLAPDDAALFRDAVGEAKPIPDAGRIAPPRPRAHPLPRQRSSTDHAAPDLLSDHLPQAIETNDELTFLRPGVAAQALRRLRRGHWLIKDELDLHGLTRDQARESLVSFLNHCEQHDSRCVRIIHGKGLSSKNHEPVLKQLVKSWLMQREEVLAFVPARPAEGGGGAVIVLLKRGKKPRNIN